MQYLGGKSRIAKSIAEVINANRYGWPVWDAFCGGLSTAAAIGGDLICTDLHAGLIALYQACARGDWSACAEVSPAEYAAAKALPDTSPRKAFVGFGSSFGGKWFGGFAKCSPKRFRYAHHCDQLCYSREAKARISERLDKLHRAQFIQGSFFDVEPATLPLILYLDPPYAASTAYKGVAPFDSDAFWGRATEWARLCPVYVSEYTAPAGWVPCWEGSAKSTGLRGARREHEKLFVWGG